MAQHGKANPHFMLALTSELMAVGKYPPKDCLTRCLNKIINLKLDGSIPTIVESIPGHQHYIENIGKEELLVLLWSNELFNIDSPDTFVI